MTSNELPSRFEDRKKILAPVLTNIGDGLPFRSHDMEALVFDPDSALKIALPLFGRARFDIEDEAAEVIQLLQAGVLNDVLLDFIAGKGEGQILSNVA